MPLRSSDRNPANAKSCFQPYSRYGRWRHSNQQRSRAIVEPPERLSYEWNAGDGLRTVVTWTLELVENGTRLRMAQSGFTDVDEQNFRGAQFGWEKFLCRFEVVLEYPSW